MKPVLNFPRIGKTLLAAALVAMAGSAAADQSLLGKLGSIFGASTETKAAASKGIEGDIDAAKALQFLYGNLQAVQPEGEEIIPKYWSQEWALWKNPECSKLGSSSLGSSCPKEVKVHSIFDARYTEQGKEKYFLLTRTRNNSDNPRIFGAAVFSKDGGQWVLDVENRYISDTPDFRQPLNKKYLSPDAEDVHGMGFACFLSITTEPSLVRVGLDKHGILLRAHGLNTSSGGTDCLVVVMPYGDNIGSFIIDTVDYWYGKDGEVGEWDMRHSFDEKSSGEYYDVVVRYQARARGRKAKKSGVRRFQFRDGEYYEVAAPKADKKGAKKRK